MNNLGKWGSPVYVYISFTFVGSEVVWPDAIQNIPPRESRQTCDRYPPTPCLSVFPRQRDPQCPVCYTHGRENLVCLIQICTAYYNRRGLAQQLYFLNYLFRNRITVNSTLYWRYLNLPGFFVFHTVTQYHGHRLANQDRTFLYRNNFWI